MLRRASDEELLAGVLHLRIERWLEQEGVLDVAGFGDVELVGELDWESGAGPVYLGDRPSTAESGSGLVSGLLVAEDSFDDFGVLGWPGSEVPGCSVD